MPQKMFCRYLENKIKNDVKSKMTEQMLRFMSYYRTIDNFLLLKFLRFYFYRL